MAPKNPSDTLVNLVNIAHVVFCGLLAASALICLYHDYCCGSFTVAVFADVYLLSLIFSGALRSDGKTGIKTFLPDRAYCLLAFGCLLFAIVFSFAGIYLNSDIKIQANPEYVQQCLPSKECTLVPRKDNGLERLEGKTNAVYFSTVTITTLGYGDYTPRSEKARATVVWELVTGILMLIIAFPLLICRIAIFEAPDELCFYRKEHPELPKPCSKA